MAEKSKPQYVIIKETKKARDISDKHSLEEKVPATEAEWGEFVGPEKASLLSMDDMPNDLTEEGVRFWKFELENAFYSEEDCRQKRKEVAEGFKESLTRHMVVRADGNDTPYSSLIINVLAARDREEGVRDKLFDLNIASNFNGKRVDATGFQIKVAIELLYKDNVYDKEKTFEYSQTLVIGDAYFSGDNRVWLVSPDSPEFRGGKADNILLWCALDSLQLTLETRTHDMAKSIVKDLDSFLYQSLPPFEKWIEELAKLIDSESSYSLSILMEEGGLDHRVAKSWYQQGDTPVVAKDKLKKSAGI